MDIYKQAIDLLLSSMRENLHDLKGKRAFAEPEERDYIEGRIFSYVEMEAIIKDIYKELGL